ncbi:uncharacterized protein L969DRAFT_94223 [Mixia osmundae IAM 14324]|uniref:DUF7719 domain-containing protein n=1 Tax=Mixia osmundae (strain CBS 9802 / IAM 14324 / JCM 22182 / KY 12970) TaxID=764103 RepID=G7E6F5_MIXOS|nr:uncharacterized protein L969DRAFT_94223 [Mixia osmundae IAM 14324]KEI40428.1 hypothetical protein L969DRAFT_94223 [Mixia osmundae IAM 14324]GAA98415.1 hypothetical protein E5Q_05100 [Mixia osmundae IAM 14324]
MVRSRRRAPVAQAEPLRSMHAAEIDSDEEREAQRFTTQDKEAVETMEDAPFTFSEATERLFQTFAWCMLMLALFCGLVLAVHKQYAQEITIRIIAGKVANFAPGLAVLVWLSLRFSGHRAMRSALCAMSCLAGAVMIDVVNKASYQTVRDADVGRARFDCEAQVIQRTPPLSVIWIWAVVQAPLPDALGSLAIVGLASWYRGNSLVFAD